MASMRGWHMSAQWLNIADIVTANDSTGFAALTDK